MAEHSLIPLVGIDTGGTFTDLVLYDRGRLRHCKVLSTPDDPSRAIAEGLQRLAVNARPVYIVHGTTVGTNAVLEGKGARVAYLTSAGFADVLSLGRQQREDVYSLHQHSLEPPVRQALCLETSSRIDAGGQLHTPGSKAELESLRQQLADLKVESLAINLLFSFLRPEEEQRLARALGDGLFVSCSSTVLPEIREYERGIATWLNASVGPVIGRYLDQLRQRQPQAKISVMQSAGTTVAADQAAEQAVRLLLSGPAGGLAAARLAGAASASPRMLTLDMGGTSTDVALLDGEIPLTTQASIGRWPLTTSSVDIHTIGAGGGSVARVDDGGMLLVGPQSAGASPGPACYGQGGTEVTVTDANLVLGRIPEDTLLGGYLPLDGAASRAAMGRLARQLGCSRMEAAQGVLRIANEHMARALRVISVERGHDPRDYRLFCFGGAGGLHACELADILQIPEVTLPAMAGVFSAQGMLASEPGRDLARAVLSPLAQVSMTSLNQSFVDLEALASAQLQQEGIEAGDIGFQRRVELRYLGQSSSLLLNYQDGQGLEARFHEAHQRFAGHALEHEVELVNVRLGARAPAPLDQFPAIGRRASGVPSVQKQVLMATKPGRPPVSIPVYQRRHLVPGVSVNGPAIIGDTVATAWLPANWQAAPDQWGHLQLSRRASS